MVAKMSVPVEYTDARDSLIAFRNKILIELVTGRVLAGLDAGHDGMLKYSDLINKLSITPYIFGKVREKALALKLNSKDIGTGKMVQAKTDFIGSRFPYPLNTPYQVSQRLLPEVDVFKYEPVKDVTMLEKASEEIWRSLFLVQADHNEFKESPDMENVVYDYYSLRPMGRVNCVGTIVNPETGYSTWLTLRAEATLLALSLTPQTDSTIKDYYFRCYLDADILGASGKIATLPVVIEMPSDTVSLGKIVFSCAGKHIFSNVKKLYAGWIEQGNLIGWGSFAESLNFTTYEVVWSAMSELEIQVNNILYGTTDPIPAIYSQKSIDVVTVDAVPNSGCEVKRWELDGVQYPPSSSFTTKMFRNHVLLCVLGIQTMSIIRPTANGDVIELACVGVPTHNWEMVDEVYADDNLTFVSNVSNCLVPRRDLYQLGNVSLPSGAIVDDVIIYARVRSDYDEPERRHFRTVIKTYSTEYMGGEIEVGKNWLNIATEYTKNPFTDSAWTESEINALQAGIRIDAGCSGGVPSYFGKCTQVWVEVSYHVP